MPVDITARQEKTAALIGRPGDYRCARGALAAFAITKTRKLLRPIDFEFNCSAITMT